MMVNGQNSVTPTFQKRRATTTHSNAEVIRQYIILIYKTIHLKWWMQQFSQDWIE